MDVSPAEAAQEILRRRAARDSLIAYTEYTLPKYKADPFHHIVAEALERVEAGACKRLMIFAPPQHGKALAENTEVLTAEGWKNHGDLLYGDYVYHPNGKPVMVIGKTGPCDMNVRVELTDGTVVRCHENHEWTVFDRSGGRRGWFTYETKHFLRKTKFGKPVDLFASGRASYQLPVPEPIQAPEADLPLAPYAMGAWLGDGSSKAPYITHHRDDVAVVNAIEALGYPVSGRVVHATTGVITTRFSGPRPNVRSAFSQGLKDAGVLGNKHIPLAYKMASLPQRLELLAGLIDTDGYVYADNGRVVISTVSTVLAADIADVVRSIGIRATIHAQEAALSSSGIQSTKPTLQVSFTPSIHIPTRLARKATTHLQSPRRIGIRSVTIENVGAVGHCIQVDSPDGLYLVTRNLVPTHNSELSTRRFPSWFLGRNPSKSIISASYNGEFATTFGREVRDIIEDRTYQRIFPGVRVRADNRSASEWQLEGQQGQEGKYFAVGISTATTGKGAHLFLIDDPIKDQKDADSSTKREDQWNWYRSVAFTRLQEGASIVMTLTRWHYDDIAGRALQLMEQGKGLPWEVLVLPALAEPRKDADGRPILLPDGTVPGDLLRRRPNEPLAPGRYSLETLLERREVSAERTWSAMYQQRPMPEEGGMFRVSWLLDQQGPLPTKRTRVRAWDLGATVDGDWTVGVLMSRDSDGFFYIENVVRKRGTANEVEKLILDTAAEDGRSVAIHLPQDPGQAGKSQVSYLIRKLAGYRVKSQRPTGPKATRAEPFASQCEAGHVFLGHGHWREQFLDELSTFPLGTHDDQVDAAADAFNALLGPRKAQVRSW